MYEPKVAADAILGSAAITYPWWVTFLHEGLTWYVAVVAAVLVTLRAIKAYQEIQSKGD